MPALRNTLLGLLLVFTGQVHAAPDIAIEPATLQALERMGIYLRSLKQFGVEAHSQTDQVLESGQTVEFRHTTQLLAQQPDKLMVSVDNQGVRRTLYYNGKRFTCKTIEPEEIWRVIGNYASAAGRAKKGGDRKSTRLNSSHYQQSRMPSSA